MGRFHLFNGRVRRDRRGYDLFIYTTGFTGLLGYGLFEK